MGTYHEGNVNILVKKGGKTELRGFGVHNRSGGYSAPDWRGQGLAGGGYLAQSPQVPRSGQEAEGKSTGHGKEKRRAKARGKPVAQTIRGRPHRGARPRSGLNWRPLPLHLGNGQMIAGIIVGGIYARTVHCALFPADGP